MKTKVKFIALFTILFSTFWFGCQEQITEPNLSQLRKLQFVSEPNESSTECNKVADLWAGAGNNNLSKGEDVGDVYLHIEDGIIKVDFEVDEGSDWFLIEAHLWISPNPASINNFPQKAAPGKFPYNVNLSAVNQEIHTIEVDPAELGLEDPCSTNLFLATHAVIGKFDTYGTNIQLIEEEVEALTVSPKGYGLKNYSNKLIEEAAWGYSEDCSKTFIDLGISNKWGWVFCAEVCCENSNGEWQIYGSNFGMSDEIYMIDPVAKTRTLVYNPGTISTNQNYPNGNAFDPDNKRIYFGTDDGNLFYHKLGSNSHIQVAAGFGQVVCGAWYDGKYYYAQKSSKILYEVTINENVATRSYKGIIPSFTRYGDMAFDPQNSGRFIASSGIYWYAYDLNTRRSKVLYKYGDGGLSHKQLAFGSDGVLYAVETETGEFFTVKYSWDEGTIHLTSYWKSGFKVTDLASGPASP